MSLSILKSARERINWENERERKQFHKDFEYLVQNWEGPLPNLRDFFRREEIDWLLTQSLIYYDNRSTEAAIDFVIRSGYKDEPDVDEGEKPSLRRTTPVHHACYRGLTCTIYKLFQIYNRFDMNYSDESGFTHFHVPCKLGYVDIVDSTDKFGSTLLHIICREYLDDNLLKTFFEVCDNMQLTLQVDGLDNLGRTPLQWAVANFSPRMVDLLLDHGADVSKFIFPTECYFDKLRIFWIYNSSLNAEALGLASGALMIVERLENRGYELDQSGALTIMKLFAKLKIFEKSVDLHKRWCDDEDFASKARGIMIRDNDQSLSLYDLIQLRPAEASKRLKYEDYYDFSKSKRKLIDRACIIHLCEKMLRRFFQRWALEFFMELTHYKLPILCCEKIIEKLMNQDLSHICMAATGQSH